MTKDDEGEVSRLLCACYRLLGGLEGLKPEAVDYLISERGSVQSIRKEALQQSFLVAESEGRIAGMVAVGENRVLKLYVRPSDQGRGIGRALFIAAEVTIRRSGYNDLTLGSSPSAAGFYRAMGLSVIGRKHLDNGPLSGHTIILMSKDLAPM